MSIRINNSAPINYNNQEYILQILQDFEKNPQNVDPQWEIFFSGMDFAERAQNISVSGEVGSKKLRIEALMQAYKCYGHLASTFNPMMENPKPVSVLELNNWGFSESERKEMFPTCGLSDKEEDSLENIEKRLKELYTGNIAFEISHCESDMQKKILSTHFYESEKPIDASYQKQILNHLLKAKNLEDYLQKKFLGAKRFSIEGAESFIPIMFTLLEKGSELGIENTVLGMAHRGRVNVLTNICAKPYSLIMYEFHAKAIPSECEGLGDVKYHKGYDSVITLANGKKMHISLASNPSHLESVDPVVLGMAKAEQKLGKSVLPILVHGDASVAGQGVVYEHMQLSKVDGFSIGGVIHVVINNQLGFTATPQESRSTRYCTDIAKGFNAPIIHVNAEDPHACVYAARIAICIWKEFGCDVFIDLNGHRLWGHNETDEPRFTNPIPYEQIRGKKDIYHEYQDKLLSQNLVDKGAIEKEEQDFKSLLDQEFDRAEQLSQQELARIDAHFTAVGEKFVIQNLFEQVDTKIALARLQSLGQDFTKIPESLSVHRKITKLYEDRKKHLLAEPNQPVIDWATAEFLAYGSLIEDGFSVRLTGQDARRGTFSHRHACIIDQKTEEAYAPLDHLPAKQGSFEAYNSILSEYAVLGYEYGYSLFAEKTLVIWEAQFGDFANGAQIVIDQYLSSSETKWGEASNMVLFLPNGNECMGSEHTSCRLERYLELSGLNNWRVCYPTTPVQMFHLLRRQMLSSKKKPLIVASPKGLLRLPETFSCLQAFSENVFMEIIDDTVTKENVKRIILCTGKIYYDLRKKQKEVNRQDVAIIRVEQIYPFHQDLLQKILDQYTQVQDILWVQEEGKNQGAWNYLENFFQKVCKKPVQYVGRNRIPAPITGYAYICHKEQNTILERAFS